MASGKDFPELDRRAATHVRDAAEHAGVGRIIYLGGLQPREAASAHLDSRRETGEVLRSGSVPVTEIRAGDSGGTGLGSLRSHPRPRLPPTCDGDAPGGSTPGPSRSPWMT